jgi:hypothetical protein
MAHKKSNMDQQQSVTDIPIFGTEFDFSIEIFDFLTKNKILQINFGLNYKI